MPVVPDPIRPPGLTTVRVWPPVSRLAVTVAIDAGTSGVRALVVDDRARVVDVAYRELTQHYPRPGWVEHDADRDLGGGPVDPGRGGRTTGRRRAGRAGRSASPTSARPWWPGTGAPAGPCTGPSSGRTAAPRPPAGSSARPATSRWSASGPGWSSTRTSPPPRCSGSCDQGGLAHPDADLALGTVDSWVLWNLTGGTDGGVFATDATNASRTMLFDIVVRRWSAELCDLFGVPGATLPEVRPSCGRFGPGVGGGPRGRLAPPRGADQRDGRRPARRPVRPGLLRPRA